MVSGHCVLVTSGRGGARLSVMLVPMQTCHGLLVHVRCRRVLAAAGVIRRFRRGTEAS